MDNRLSFEPLAQDDFVIVSSTEVAAILVDSNDDEAVHIAANTFADDVERVSGRRPTVHVDKVPSAAGSTIIAATTGSHLFGTHKAPDLAGKWEAFDIRVGNASDIGAALCVTGSDKRGVIFALYTLSEHMGVSPWYWWADVPVKRRSYVSFPRASSYRHGSPTVKYRGFFLNDEQPVLWEWAKEHFKMGDKPPFQVGMYEKAFELLLRLKGNYAWPARIRRSIPTWGTGSWNYEENEKFLVDFWRYGAERAKGFDTLFTVGMRGDGDLPLDGANVSLLEKITAKQQDLLRDTYGDISKIPQMWAIYKEVMGYYANGLAVPDEVTAMLADDNWGNLMAVLPDDRRKPGAGGIYYHADYVGDPRSYKWINTVPLAKMWEQLHIARSFDMTEIWILNVGDLKFLETPLEFFMQLAYDSDRWPRGSMLDSLTHIAGRDYGREHADEIGEIMALYSMYASRRKAELLDHETFSLINYDESNRILSDWRTLEKRASKVFEQLDETKTAFYEMIYVQIQLQANLNELYNSAAKSNLYASQGRTAANYMAQRALQAFDRDHDLTEDFNGIENGKWRNMLCQTHIGYMYWQMPARNSMPPVSYVSQRTGSFAKGRTIYTRYTVENSLGAWPGDHKFNNATGYDAPDPTVLPMNRFGQSRWVDIGSGGPQTIHFTVEADHDWVLVQPSSGTITGDGSSDARVWISIDWDRAEGDSTYVNFTASDGACIRVTVPLRYHDRPTGFRGGVQGDDYVVFEAAHCTEDVPAEVGSETYSWKEIPYYGRTHSGMAMYPIENYALPVGQGPYMRYDFWSTEKDEVEVVLHLGPSNNWILGKCLAFGIQMDEQELRQIEPIPLSAPGELSPDWEEIVAKEVREVKVIMPLGKAGKHSLKVFGVTPGLVFERVMIDLGGIRARGDSYLGPPESVIL